MATTGVVPGKGAHLHSKGRPMAAVATLQNSKVTSKAIECINDAPGQTTEITSLDRTREELPAAESG